MKHNKGVIWFLFIFLSLTSIIIGFSAFIINTTNKTNENITHSDSTTNFYDVNVHYETIAEGLETTTEYFIPNTYTISHGITDVDANGNNYGTDKMKAPTYNGTAGTLEDELPIQIYYDVYNGTRTKINRRSNSAGPEQIRSFECDVSSWTQVTDETSYAVVWQTNVTKSDGTKDSLYFQCDSGNTTTHSQQWAVGDVYSSDQIISQNSEIINGASVTTTIYQRITVYDVDELVYGNVKVGCVTQDYANWVYYPQYEIRMTRITTKGHDPIYYDSVDTIKVKENSIVTPIDLSIANYTNYGYYKNSDFTEYFDFSEPIASNTDIYLRFIESSNYIASSINNLTSGSLSLHDQYRGGSGDGVNIGSDMTYHINTYSVFIDSASINSGVTVNLIYGSDEIYISPNTGSISENLGNHRTTNDYAIATDYNGSTSLTYCGYDQASVYIILNGDLTINGTLNIGGEVGGRSASTFYSYIIGRYALLDLHGHTITINDGGVLNNFGLIKDTVGGGQIIVNSGGKITSTVTIADARGRDQTAVGLSKRQSLFTEYNISYLQVPCKFYKGSTLEGYCKIDFQELGIVNSYITFIGNTFNSCMFNFNSNSASTDYILYEPYKISALSTPSTNTIYTKMYNYRSRFTFNANVQEAGSYIINATLSNSTYGDIDADFDFARIDFPISPMFDFVINKGYSLDVYSKMTFYPGSSLYAKKGSTINFKPTGYKTYDRISATGNTLAISGENRYIAGGLMSYTSNIRDLANYNFSGNRFGVGLYSQTSYWTYVKPNNIVIDGSITFDSSINTSSYSDARYFISGKMAMSEESINSIIQNRNYVQTYDVKAELYGGFFYNNSSQNLTGQFEKATSFNLNPLILNDEAYVLNATYNMKGTYDTDTGIFTCEGNMYYFQMDNDLYTDGSSSSNQGSTIDRTITVKQISDANTNYKIIRDVDSNLYVYYCGIYVPIIDARYSYGDLLSNGYNLNVNLRKFHSNKDNTTYTGNVTRYTYDSSTETYVTQEAETGVLLSPLYDNCLIYYNTSTKKWTFRGFIK